MSTRHLISADDVIAALGGDAAVQGLTQARGRQSVSNWRKANRFPSRTYVVMTEGLIAIDCTAPVSLWGQIELVPEDLDEDETEEETADV